MLFPPYTIPVLEGRETSILLALVHEQVTPDPNNASVENEKTKAGLQAELCSVATLNEMRISFDTCDKMAAMMLGTGTGEGVTVTVTLLVALVEGEVEGTTPNDLETDIVEVSEGVGVSETETVVETEAVVDIDFV